MSARDDKCEALVSEPPHYFHVHRCSFTARVEIEGRRLCHVHRKIVEKHGIAAQRMVDRDGDS